MKQKEVIFIFLRYILLAFIALGNLYFIYLIATPLTFYSSFIILKTLFNAELLNSSTLIVKGFRIELIGACIAGAAYYLLLILNLSTPMKPKQRVRSLIFTLSTFLILNILRIVIFSILLINDFQYFDIAHKYTWYFGSTIMLIAIWFINVSIFNIKSIPVYSDLKSLLKQINKM